MQQKRIKVIYPGGPVFMAKVVDADTGELIRGVTRVDISLSIADGVSAVVTAYNSQLPAFSEPLLELEELLANIDMKDVP